MIVFKKVDIKYGEVSFVQILVGYKFANKAELQTAISAWNGFYATDWLRENFPPSYYGHPNTWDVSAINDFGYLSFGSFNFDRVEGLATY